MNKRTLEALSISVIVSIVFQYLSLLSVRQPYWFPVFRDRFTPKDFINYDTASFGKGVSPTPTPAPINMEHLSNIIIMKEFLETEFYYETLEFEYIGTYFITAYSPEECGYNGSNYPSGWVTASDTICHQSSDWKTPNTCAIDRNYHKYGEYLLVGDPEDPDNRQIVITEDCGPGVKGHWIDVFVDSYDQVVNWNTRYDSVYRVHYVGHTITGREILAATEWGYIGAKDSIREYM